MPRVAKPDIEQRLVALSARVRQAEASGDVNSQVGIWQRGALNTALAAVRELGKLPAIHAQERGAAAKVIVEGANLLREAWFEARIQHFAAAKPDAATAQGLALSAEVTAIVHEVHQDSTATVARYLGAPDPKAAIAQAQKLAPLATAALKRYAFTVAEAPGTPKGWQAAGHAVERSVGSQVALSALVWAQVHAMGGTTAADCGYACVKTGLTPEADRLTDAANRPARASLTLDNKVGAWTEEIAGAHTTLATARRALDAIGTRPRAELKRAGNALQAAVVRLHFAAATDVNGLLTDWDPTSPVAKRMRQQQHQYTQLRARYVRAYAAATPAVKRTALAPAHLRREPWDLTATLPGLPPTRPRGR